MRTTTLLTIIGVLSGTTLLQVATCSDKEKVLKVSIVANYTPPGSFNFKPPFYRAGSSLTLFCEVEGAENDNSGLLYDWRSSCSGSCFVRGGTTKSVSTQYLRSLDNGIHTCIVHDRGGCTGNASITVMIKGASIFVESPRNENLPNNSLIVETGRYLARIPQFHGLSASNRSYVGQLIDPQGRDITSSSTDPFIVSLGSNFEPGTMRVRCFRSLQRSEVGIYTYRTPDEAGIIIDVNFGLYSSSFSQAPVVTNLNVSLGGKTPLLLSCASQYSPPTQVIWRKDGQQINVSADGYKMSQFLVDRVSSSYVSTLSKDGVLDDVVGEYSCTVTNTLGTSNTRNVTVDPITITGHEAPIIVGLSGAINCTTILNASKIEWRLVGIGGGVPFEEANWKQSLVLTLIPEETELNGAKFTCQVTTAKQSVFEKTVTVTIKELDNVVRIEGPSNATLVGEKMTYTCVVTSDFLPTVQWLDKNNNSITTSGDTFWTENQYTIGKTTYKNLVFEPVRTSHGGSYTCKSVIHTLSSTNSTSRNIVIKLVQNSVYIESSPGGNHFTGQSLTLTCWTHLNNTVDTSTQVTHTWTGPGGTIRTDSRRTLSQVSARNNTYYSTLTFSSLRTSDSGSYYCRSTSRPSSSYSHHTHISSSDTSTASTSVNAVINVTITISYTSPDPGYSPPNYRAASGVTLTCRAVGVSGSVSYRWSSTCSSCFASSSSSSSVSKTFLVARDAGTHTCTVTDSSGNRGSNRTTMNIVGIGIYVETSRGTGTGLNSGAQPNNSYALVDTGSGWRSTRFYMYCCSSSRYSTVYLTYPSGYKISSGRYSSYDYTYSYSSSDSYAGCTYFYYSRSSYRSFYLSYPGIYTCSAGNEISSIALYSESSSISSIYITSLQRVAWSSRSPASLIIRTDTYYSPPSKITWYRNDQPIDTKQSNVSAMAYITSRSSVYYKLELTIKGAPEDVVGQYSLRVSNGRGTNTRTLSSNITGAELTCNSTKFVIGIAVNCTCTSDLRPTRVQWYKGNDSLSSCSNNISRYRQSIYGSASTIVIPGADDHGKTLTCETDTPHGTQRVFIEMEIEVPDTWGLITVESSTEAPLHNTSYSITCKLSVSPGMDLQVLIQWLSQNGSVVTSQDYRTIETRNTTNIPLLQSSVCHGPAHQNIFHHSMTYDPISNSDGGVYSCQASVSVPWMRLQPPKLKKQISIPVTTQAKFQLKVYPVTHCSTWDVEKAQALDRSVKLNLEKGISSLCNCSFNSTRIHSSEFSCQPKSCSSDESCGPSNSAVSPVTYRAVVNGTSDFLTADQIMTYIDMWREDTGTLLHEMFRLRVYSKKKCGLKVDSFNEKEC